MTNNDSWDKLLSDFGIEKPAENQTDNKFVEQFVEKTVEPPKKPVSAPAAVEVREKPTENTAEENSSEEKAKSKKSFFSRFPKINIFGSAPTESLDAIAEGVKSPSLGGKPFTGKTIEKSPGYVEKKTKKKEEFAEETAPQETDGWSVVASQISVIASGDAPKTSRNERRPYKPASIFEDEVPKSEEFLALQDLLEDSESPSRTDSRQKREPVSRGRSNRNDFDRNRNDEERPGGKNERYGRGRGRVAEPPVPVDDDDFENSVWQEVDDTDSPVIEEPRRNGRENTARENTGGRNDRRDRDPRDTRGERTQGRGQRNAVLHDMPKSGGENEVQRNEPRREERPQRGGSRGKRYAENKPDYNKPDYEPRDFERQDDKPEQNYKQKRDYEPEQDYPEQDYEGNADGNAAESSAQLHRNMPGWEDAVGDIVAGNIARHRNSPPYRSGKR